MTRLALLVTTIALWMGVAPASASASSPVAATLDGVGVVVAPTSASVVLGESIDLTVTLTNTSSQPTDDLVAHLDVTDPARATSVDPEDWTGELSQPVGVLDPGASATVDWTIQPIAPGEFAVYAVALSAGQSSVAASNVLIVSVEDQRTLNPGGVLPVALGAPALVGGLLLLQIRLARRAGRAGDDADRPAPAR
jgi:hypothetical protein